MTSKLTREQLHERARENVKALKMASRQTAFESAREEILADLQLAELALAAMDSEPVAALKLPPKLSNDRERAHELNTGVDIWNRCIDEVAKINGEMIIAGRVDGLHPSTMALVNDFATALADKLHKAELKYGYSNAWTNNGWMTECLAEFHRHIAKGDPRDVAAYCAFMWYHGWKTEAAQPAPERDQVRIAHAEWSQATFGNVGPVGPLKHLSKEALEAAEQPGDLSEWADMQFLLWDAQCRAGVTDEQITQAMIDKLAVNKQRKWPEPKDGEPRLHIKEQPAPVVPDSYVMVPMRLTAENGAKGALSGEFSETRFVNCPECFGDDECETCDGSGKIEITVPVTWSTIKEIWAKGVEHFSATPREVKGE